MPDPRRIMQLASAFYDSQVLFVTSDTGIFGYLAEHPEATADDVARDLQLAPRGARLLLDAAVAIDLLEKHGDHYRNTQDSAQFLVPGQPGDLSRAIRYNRDVYQAWGQLGTFVRSGLPVERPALHLGDDPERTRTFVMAMHGRALGIGQLVVPMLDLQDCRQVLDVGGGPGTYSVLLAQRYPHLHATVLDLPGVAAVATELIAAQGLAERVRTLPGDYHSEPFPAGNDAVLLFGMLHQESPDSIRDLLHRAAASLSDHGRIYILDMMTDESHTQPPFSALFGLNMALTTDHGWVFSDAELSDWCAEAGLDHVEIQPLPPPMPHWLAIAQPEPPPKPPAP